MIEEIVEFILKIPAMIEFIIGAIIYIILSNVFGEIVSGVAQETVCKLPGISNWFLCFYLTNPLMAFLLTVGTVVTIGLIFRVKFL